MVPLLPADRAETTDHKELDTDQQVDLAHQAADLLADLPAAAHPVETLDMELQPESQPAAVDTADRLLPQRLPQPAALATKDHQDLPDLKDH